MSDHTCFNLHRRIPYLLYGLIFVFMLTGCASSTNSDNSQNNNDGKIQIVAVESFYAEVAEAIGGDRVQVLSVIRGHDVDPHDFEPTTETARQIHHADIIIYNGLGYDDWVEKMIASSGGNTKTVINVGEDVLDKKHGDNEHIWYHPGTMPKLAKLLVDKLSSLEPSHGDEYKANETKYAATLAPLTEMIQQLEQPTPVAVAVTEPVFDYMLEQLNYTVSNARFAKAIAEETDPAATDIVAFQNSISQKKIQFIVHNVQTHSPIVTNIIQLAKTHQIPVVEVTEMEPEGFTYVQWMTEQLQQIAALKQ